MALDSGTPAEIAPSEGNPTVVELPEPDDEGEATAASPEARATRADKKRERQSLREENDRLRQEQAAAAERAQRFEVELAELKGRVSATPQNGHQDEHKERISQLRKRANDVLSLVSEGKATMDDWYDMNDQIQDARMEAKQRASGATPAMTANEIEQAVTRRAMETDFPWLPHNPQARRWADGAYDQLIAEGRPEGPATVKEALSMASAKFGLGGSRTAPVSDAQKRLYAGVSSRETGGNGAVSVRFDEKTRKLAEARWSDLPPREAHSKMAELLKRKAKERGEL